MSSSWYFWRKTWRFVTSPLPINHFKIEFILITILPLWRKKSRDTASFPIMHGSGNSGLNGGTPTLLPTVILIINQPSINLLVSILERSNEYHNVRLMWWHGINLKRHGIIIKKDDVDDIVSNMAFSFKLLRVGCFVGEVGCNMVHYFVSLPFSVDWILSSVSSFKSENKNNKKWYWLKILWWLKW